MKTNLSGTISNLIVSNGDDDTLLSGGIVNFGAIFSGGSLTVNAGATVYGLAHMGGTTLNYGAIQGNAATSGMGVYLAGGRLTNYGTISGGDGGFAVDINGGAVLDNAGVVNGGANGPQARTRKAINFSGAGGVLVIEQGATIGGQIYGNADSGVNSTIELAAFPTFTLTPRSFVGIGSAYITQVANLKVDAGATYSFINYAPPAVSTTVEGLAYDMAIRSGQKLTVANGGVVIGLSVEGGKVEAQSGSTVSLGLSPAVGLTVDSGATVIFGRSVAGSNPYVVGNLVVRPGMYGETELAGAHLQFGGGLIAWNGSVELTSFVTGIGEGVYGTLTVDAFASDSGSYTRRSGAIIVRSGGSVSHESVESSGSSLTLLSGALDNASVIGAGATMNVAFGASANADTIKGLLNLSGNATGDYVSGAAVVANGGTFDFNTITDGGRLTVQAGGEADYNYFYGKGDVATFYQSSLSDLFDYGSGLQVNVGNSGVNLSLSGFGTIDKTGVIDLLNGAGGYATAAAAFAALKSDGHGGSMLSLGSSGSIDFTDAALGKLTVANFKIG